MPRYFFHIRVGDVLEIDTEGAEFTTIDGARAEAAKAAREMLSAQLLADEILEWSSFEITAEDGSLLAVVTFKSAIRSI